MKFESFPSRESAEPSLELPSRLRGSLDALRERFGKFMPLALLSFMAIAPSKMEAQEFDSLKTKEYAYESLFNPDEVAEAESQRTWLLNYIASPKYKERLTREVMHTNDMNALANAPEKATIDEIWPTAPIPENLPEKIRARVEQSIALREQATSTVTFRYVDGFESDRVGGFYFKQGQKIFAKPHGFSDEAFSPDIVKRAATIFEEPVDSAKFFMYMPDHSIALKERPREESRKMTFATAPNHEFTHASLRSEEYIEFSTKTILSLFVQDPTTETKDINSPEEIIPRLGSLRMLLDRSGIYDAKKEDFTIDHLKKLKENKAIMENFEVRQIFDLILKGTTEEKEKELIWIMNNLADAKTPILGLGEERPEALA